MMPNETEARHTRILNDLDRECKKQIATLTALHTDVLAIRASAATDLDICPLLTGAYAKLDALRKTQGTIRNHYESLTGKRALPPVLQPSAYESVFRSPARHRF